jgi:hypothetical protein
MHLQAEINWQLMELISDFDLDSLARRQAPALQAQGLPLPS